MTKYYKEICKIVSQVYGTEAYSRNFPEKSLRDCAELIQKSALERPFTIKRIS